MRKVSVTHDVLHITLLIMQLLLQTIGSNNVSTVVPSNSTTNNNETVVSTIVPTATSSLAPQPPPSTTSDPLVPFPPRPVIPPISCSLYTFNQVISLHLTSHDRIAISTSPLFLPSGAKSFTHQCKFEVFCPKVDVDQQIESALLLSSSQNDKEEEYIELLESYEPILLQYDATFFRDSSYFHYISRVDLFNSQQDDDDDDRLRLSSVGKDKLFVENLVFRQSSSEATANLYPEKNNHNGGSSEKSPQSSSSPQHGENQNNNEGEENASPRVPQATISIVEHFLLKTMIPSLELVKGTGFYMLLQCLPVKNKIEKKQLLSYQQEKKKEKEKATAEKRRMTAKERQGIVDAPSFYSTNVIATYQLEEFVVNFTESAKRIPEGYRVDASLISPAASTGNPTDDEATHGIETPSIQTKRWNIHCRHYPYDDANGIASHNVHLQFTDFKMQPKYSDMLGSSSSGTVTKRRQNGIFLKIYGSKKSLLDSSSFLQIPLIDKSIFSNEDLITADTSYETRAAPNYQSDGIFSSPLVFQNSYILPSPLMMELVALNGTVLSLKFSVHCTRIGQVKPLGGNSSRTLHQQPGLKALRILTGENQEYAQRLPGWLRDTVDENETIAREILHSDFFKEKTTVEENAKSLFRQYHVVAQTFTEDAITSDMDGHLPLHRPEEDLLKLVSEIRKYHSESSSSSSSLRRNLQHWSDKDILENLTIQWVIHCPPLNASSTISSSCTICLSQALLTLLPRTFQLLFRRQDGSVAFNFTDWVENVTNHNGEAENMFSSPFPLMVQKHVTSGSEDGNTNSQHLAVLEFQLHHFSASYPNFFKFPNSLAGGGFSMYFATVEADGKCRSPAKAMPQRMCRSYSFSASTSAAIVPLMLKEGEEEEITSPLQHDSNRFQRIPPYGDAISGGTSGGSIRNSCQFEIRCPQDHELVFVFLDANLFRHNASLLTYVSSVAIYNPDGTIRQYLFGESLHRLVSFNGSTEKPVRVVIEERLSYPEDVTWLNQSSIRDLGFKIKMKCAPRLPTVQQPRLNMMKAWQLHYNQTDAVRHRIAEQQLLQQFLNENPEYLMNQTNNGGELSILPITLKRWVKGTEVLPISRQIPESFKVAVPTENFAETPQNDVGSVVPVSWEITCDSEAASDSPEGGSSSLYSIGVQLVNPQYNLGSQLKIVGGGKSLECTLGDQSCSVSSTLPEVDAPLHSLYPSQSVLSGENIFILPSPVRVTLFSVGYLTNFSFVTWCSRIGKTLPAPAAASSNTQGGQQSQQQSESSLKSTVIQHLYADNYVNDVISSDWDGVLHNQVIFGHQNTTWYIHCPSYLNSSDVYHSQGNCSICLNKIQLSISSQLYSLKFFNQDGSLIYDLTQLPDFLANQSLLSEGADPKLPYFSSRSNLTLSSKSGHFASLQFQSKSSTTSPVSLFYPQDGFSIYFTGANITKTADEINAETQIDDSSLMMNGTCKALLRQVTLHPELPPTPSETASFPDTASSSPSASLSHSLTPKTKTQSTSLPETPSNDWPSTQTISSSLPATHTSTFFTNPVTRTLTSHVEKQTTAAAPILTTNSVIPPTISNLPTTPLPTTSPVAPLTSLPVSSSATSTVVVPTNGSTNEATGNVTTNATGNVTTNATGNVTTNATINFTTTVMPSSTVESSTAAPIIATSAVPIQSSTAVPTNMPTDTSHPPATTLSALSVAVTDGQLRLSGIFTSILQDVAAKANLKSALATDLTNAFIDAMKNGTYQEYYRGVSTEKYPPLFLLQSLISGSLIVSFSVLVHYRMENLVNSPILLPEVLIDSTLQDILFLTTNSGYGNSSWLAETKKLYVGMTGRQDFAVMYIGVANISNITTDEPTKTAANQTQEAPPKSGGLSVVLIIVICVIGAIVIGVVAFTLYRWIKKSKKGKDQDGGSGGYSSAAGGGNRLGGPARNYQVDSFGATSGATGGGGGGGYHSPREAHFSTHYDAESDSDHEFTNIQTQPAQATSRRFGGRGGNTHNAVTSAAVEMREQQPPITSPSNGGRTAVSLPHYVQGAPKTPVPAVATTSLFANTGQDQQSATLTAVTPTPKTSGPTASGGNISSHLEQRLQQLKDQRLRQQQHRLATMNEVSALSSAVEMTSPTPPTTPPAVPSASPTLQLPAVTPTTPQAQITPQQVSDEQRTYSPPDSPLEEGH